MLHLPDELLMKILNYLSFDEVSRCRLVCRRINTLSETILNKGFYRLEVYHDQCQKKVKSQLPRRESERRKHPLCKRSDILACVETRLSLLRMTYKKCMERDQCCFIPGKVLDEVYRVLRCISSEHYSVEANEVLQELRDLSSMAIEHFDEKILPILKKRESDRPKIINECVLTGINLYARSLQEKRKSFMERASTSSANSNFEKTESPSTSKATNSKEYKLPRWLEKVNKLTRNQAAANSRIHFLRQRVFQISKENEELKKKLMELTSLVSSQVEKSKEQNLQMEYLSSFVKKDSTKPPDVSGEENVLSVKNPLASQGEKSQIISTLSEASQNIEISKENEELKNWLMDLISSVSTQVEKSNEQNVKVEYFHSFVKKDSTAPSNVSGEGKVISSVDIKNLEPSATQGKKRPIVCISSETSRKLLKKE